MKYFNMLSCSSVLLAAILFSSPATASEFEVESNLSDTQIHGYGELHYDRPGDNGKDIQMDMHRMVIGVSHQFNEKMSIHTEVDFEHAATVPELEFAYVDFLKNEKINFRAGSMLMPVGSLNEYHEPVNFYSVERPYVQKYIIPTSWQEGGVGIFGSLAEGLRYKLYLVSGLNAATFSDTSGIRGGRSHVAKQKSEDMAIVGRMEYSAIPGFKGGLSVYQGAADQGDSLLGDAAVFLGEVDLEYKVNNLELRGMFATINIDDAESISAFTGKTIGETMIGVYYEAAYRLGGILEMEEQDLVLMGRFETFNLHDEIPAGFTANNKAEIDIFTYAVAYYPDPNVVIKADYENWKDGGGAKWTRFNLAIGYMF